MREKCPSRYIQLMIIVLLLIIPTIMIMAQEGRDPHSLVIVLDGVRPDLLLNVRPPAIQSLIDGSWWPESIEPHPKTAWTYTARAVEDANPNSGPNHASIMTGVSAAQHGAFTNSQFRAGVVDIARHPHYLDRLEHYDPRLTTVFLASWDADYTMIANADFRRIGQGGHGMASVLDDRRITEIAETILSGRRLDDPIMGTDSQWDGGDVDALFIFFDSTDAGGHSTMFNPFDNRGFYPFHPAYVDALLTLDGYIARILTALTERATLDQEQWQIILTTDHGGFLADHGYDNVTTRGVWFLVSSPQVIPGPLPPGVHNYDAAVTALSHFSYPLPTGPVSLDGVDRSRGADPDSPEAYSILSLPPEQTMIYPGDHNDPQQLVVGPEGFTVWFPLPADPFRYLRTSRPILTLQDSLGDRFTITIRDDYRFWVGLGGRLGNKDGTVTPDIMTPHWVRTLGAGMSYTDTATSRESYVSAIYGLLPQLDRETLIGIRIDGSGVMTLFADRSDGYLYSISGEAIPGFSAVQGTPIRLTFHESITSYRMTGAALSLPEIYRMYREGQLTQAASR